MRFVNPGDLRAAPQSCGPCHASEVKDVSKSLMTHGAFLYGAALYNNGVLPGKDAIIGESYGPDGQPRIVKTIPPPTADETLKKGVLDALVPLVRWELGMPGNPFRVFERGGRRRLEVGLPEPFEEPGKPDKGLSPRGFGTLNRTDPVILGAQKTRLLDPLLSMLGTNDHPGDFRSSGCTACHVVYANDRSPANSGPYAQFGNRGLTQIRGHDDPARRARPSAQARLHPLHPLQPVHDVPHASGHEHGRHLHGLHLVGQRGGRAAHVPEGAEEALRLRARAHRARATPRGPRSRASGRTASS